MASTKKAISPASVRQLKDDVKSLPSYSRSAWWKETLRLLDEQGFKLSSSEKRSFENIVY